MAITGNQIRAARSLVGMDQKALAEKAAVSINTVRNMEASGSERIRVRTDTIDAIIDALKDWGVVLIDDGQAIEGGPGVRMGN
jgi:transcriptional regulator with XRE-family HTH domain